MYARYFLYFTNKQWHYIHLDYITSFFTRMYCFCPHFIHIGMNPYKHNLPRPSKLNKLQLTRSKTDTAAEINSGILKQR